MRLIDADALVSQLRDKADELIPLEEGSRGNTSIFYTGVKVGLQNAAIVADDFPTIEPKRGKWEHHIGIGNVALMKCGECGFTYPELLGMMLFNFCPNCGARMDGDIEKINNAPAKDCRNCKYGKYNDHLGNYFCCNDNDCDEVEE